MKLLKQKIMQTEASLVVQWLRICVPMQGTWIWSLVGELRSHMLWDNYVHESQREIQSAATKTRCSQINKAPLSMEFSTKEYWSGLPFPSPEDLPNTMDYSPPGSSVDGILQARTLEWVAISYSRGSSRPRDRTHISDICIERRVLYH